MCRRGEHVVQRAGRADRVHAGRCLPLFYAHPPRSPRAVAVPSRRATAARMEGGVRVEAGVPARLTAAQGRRFAFTVGAAFLVLGALLLWRGRAVIAYGFGGIGIALLL